MGKGGYFILGQKIRKHARYYMRVFREKLTFGWGKSRKRARYYIRVLTENMTFGTLISRSTLIIGQNSNFWPKKSKTYSILYRSVLREKLTFGILISRETVIIGQFGGGMIKITFDYLGQKVEKMLDHQ